MIAELRRRFNQELFTPDNYALFLGTLERAAGAPIPFRLSETPVFLDPRLLDRMVRTSQQLLAKLIADQEYRELSTAVIPERYRVPEEASCPLFVQADYGIVRVDGQLEPRLVEIQGFPSLYAFQPLMAETYRRVYGLNPTLRTLLSELDLDAYWALLRQAIVGDHDPENVVLLEIHPEQQKTRCDFRMTEKALGIRTVCLTAVKQYGSKLFYELDGRMKPIYRIYNRTIVDELDRLGVEAPFAWQDDLQVEWAGHPNWYFRLSKMSLPFFDHPDVPRTFFLPEVKTLPQNLEQWVLKPLFSFAGNGVTVGPTAEQIQAITDPHDWILQERMVWEPVIDTPAGPTSMEVRIMLVWFEGGDPIPVNTIIRTGRGKMMGVDYNKGLEWVGASAAFYPR